MVFRFFCVKEAGGDRGEGALLLTAEMIGLSAVFEEALRREFFHLASILYPVEVANCRSVIGTQVMEKVGLKETK